MRREVEVDTALAHLWSEREGLYRSLDQNRQTIARMSGAERTRTGSYTRFLGTSAEWVEALTTKLGDGSIPTYNRDAGWRALAKETDLTEKIADLNAKIAPLDAEYNAAPWSRFFLVQNHGGHIHRSMHCSTCRPTTRFGWLPTLSGLTEKDAVEAHGPLLCTVCYPSAPVEWTLGAASVVDPNTCPAEGLVDGSFRPGWNGNGRGQCKSCRRGVSVTTNGKIRKHKKEA